MQLIPNSFGSFKAWFWEGNPCHEPRTGKFAFKNQGNCAPGFGTGSLDATTLTPEQIARVRPTLDGKAWSPTATLAAAGPAFTHAYSSMMSRAPSAQQELEQGLTSAMRRVGGEMVPYSQITEGEGVRASIGNIKGAQRLMTKAVEDYRGDVTRVSDIVRASVAVDRPDQIPGVLAELRRRFNVTREKDRFAQPLNGYRDHLINFQAKNGLTGEIQVHVKTILKVKETVGHRIYMQTQRLLRSPFGPLAARHLAHLAARSAAIYTSAWLVALRGGVLR